MTVDDDMLPIGIFCEGANQSTAICEGTFIPKTGRDYEEKDQNIARAFLDVLGKKVSEIKIGHGKHIFDDSVDFYSNNSKGPLSENIKLVLKPGQIKKDCIVKIAQTYRTGSPDIDAIDYINAYFDESYVIATNDLNKIFALNSFSPCITKTNWRIDSGVCALDNRHGLPPFIPTVLRFEDYIFRIWTQKENVATAHVNAVQTHRKSLNRPSMASSFLNEEMAALLKRELRRLAKSLYATHIEFGSNLEITEKDLRSILEKGLAIKDKAEKEARRRPRESHFFFKLANDMDVVFDSFDAKTFGKKTRTILAKEFELLLATMEIWPKIVGEAMEMPKNMKQLSSGEEIENFTSLDTVFKG